MAAVEPSDVVLDAVLPREISLGVVDHNKRLVNPDDGGFQFSGSLKGANRCLRPTQLHFAHSQEVPVDAVGSQASQFSETEAGVFEPALLELGKSQSLEDGRLFFATEIISRQGALRRVLGPAFVASCEQKLEPGEFCCGVDVLRRQALEPFVDLTAQYPASNM